MAMIKRLRAAQISSRLVITCERRAEVCARACAATTYRTHLQVCSFAVGTVQL
jgi:hypothetical protein